MKSVIRSASGQGFRGDPLDAPKQQVEGGPIDYLMLGYARYFVLPPHLKGRRDDVGSIRAALPFHGR